MYHYQETIWQNMCHVRVKCHLRLTFVYLLVLDQLFRDVITCGIYIVLYYIFIFFLKRLFFLIKDVIFWSAVWALIVKVRSFPERTPFWIFHHSCGDKLCRVWGPFGKLVASLQRNWSPLKMDEEMTVSVSDVKCFCWQTNKIKRRCKTVRQAS